MSTKRIFAVAGLMLAACGPTIPKELANARSAYNSVNQGGAPGVAPEAVRQARNSLDRAEQSFQDEGASANTRELASKAEQDAENAQLACARHGSGAVVIQEKREQPQEEAPVARIEEVLRTVPGTVMFEFDSDQLRPAAKEKLDQLADALKDAKTSANLPPLIVEGHTDGIGTEEYNQDLSERRAQTVRTYLTEHGADPNIMQIKAFGKDKPFASNETPEGRADNRRVEIRLGEKKSGE